MQRGIFILRRTGRVIVVFFLVFFCMAGLWLFESLYRSVLDDNGVVRNSVARIEDGVLHIEQGPLVGQEARVKKIDRHKRWCLVDVGEGDFAFRELLALDVPSKT